MQHASQSAEGFSLVEMLVALAITGFAALCLLAGVQRIAVADARIGQHRQSIDTIAAVQLQLRNRLERIAPDPDLADISKVDFAGGAQAIEFVGDAPAGTGSAALQRYRLARAGNGELVLYRRNPLALQGEDGAPWLPTPLLDGVDHLAISYLGSLGGTGEPVWQDRWTRRTTLPRAVRIHLAFAPDDPRDWPDLVVRPRAAAADSCRRDPVSGECRQPR